MNNLQKIANDYDDIIFITSANSDNVSYNNGNSNGDFNNFHIVDEIHSIDVTSYLNSATEDNVCIIGG